MPQQLAIIVLVDIGNALESRSLKDNTYLFDNMKLHGSENQGTGDLVTAINGAYWSDGSQASEQVLNWLPYSLGSIPPTVPRSYQAARTQQADRQALADLTALTGRPSSDGEDAEAALSAIRKNVGTRVRAAGRSRALAGQQVLDVTGKVVSDHGQGLHNYPAPVITDVFGEAVDEKIIYPAAYGSPDLVTDGWYWSATVDTSRPGTYTYKMRIQLHELVQRAGDWTWEPVNLVCESRLQVVSQPRRNAFTQAGLSYLPLAPGVSA
ncbi:hypothetical protein GCM10018793_60930 [Streptomyces sulfonofaciens]|uniref:Uncharacterized protein n=1 Tax=Streptomyces sulfonofaciens TaxID=68272 RepID=A0A919GLQ6_9ACTN|nr:hypothetical protein [Streptomyces sulfonofaciens]GHH86974.1 hypothetical protein GCM10018793_60930 [Streptomyces sulfonofaciens]